MDLVVQCVSPAYKQLSFRACHPLESICEFIVFVESRGLPVIGDGVLTDVRLQSVEGSLGASAPSTLSSVRCCSPLPDWTLVDNGARHGELMLTGGAFSPS